MYRVVLTTIFIPLAFGQTKVDLKYQSQAVDFTAVATKPLQTGMTLPATCSSGQMFFRLGSPIGQNLFGCVTPDTWALQSPASLGVTVPGVGTKEILDFIAGSGVVLALIDTGTSVGVQTGLDTTYIQTHAQNQSGADLLCSSTSVNPGADYTCNLLPTLEQYTSGMVLRWRPDVDGIGGATTLDVDTLGAVAVKSADGVTDPAVGDIAAGQMIALWYDGAVFRIMERRQLAGVLGEGQPSCSAMLKGRLWFTPGATGVADTISACAKDASDAYAWRNLYQ